MLFKYLVNSLRSTRHFLVLIDGLDESEEDPFKLVDAIKEISSTVRVCCSSRPDLPFKTGLSTVPSLRVQDLTSADLRAVIRQRLDGTTAAEFVGRIAGRADGVFLWACVVADEVRRGISEGESMDELRSLVTNVSETSLFRTGSGEERVMSKS